LTSITFKWHKQYLYIACEVEAALNTGILEFFHNRKSFDFRLDLHKKKHKTQIMPKNKGKGGKNRRRGKNDNEDGKRELVFKEDGQEYAQVC
jgi:hypothetical protein